MSDRSATIVLILLSALAGAVVLALLVRFPPRFVDREAMGFPPGWHCQSFGRRAVAICERRPAVPPRR